jgi:uncharacterized protein (TIGR03083 family)
MDAWEMTDNERTAFADLADSLTPAQWDQQSLCGEWKVRDVVAHVTDGADLSFGKSMLTLMKYGFRMNTMIEREAQKSGAKSPEELRKGLRDSVGIHKAMAPAKPPDRVMETIVHEQDVRRPLGIPRSYPADEMTVALDCATAQGHSLLPGKKRIKDLHLKATDLDWELGDGADVTGPAEALLMAVAGRQVALADLSGPGVDTLRQRIGG